MVITKGCPCYAKYREGGREKESERVRNLSICPLPISHLSNSESNDIMTGEKPTAFPSVSRTKSSVT